MHVYTDESRSNQFPTKQYKLPFTLSGLNKIPPFIKRAVFSIACCWYKKSVFWIKFYWSCKAIWAYGGHFIDSANASFGLSQLTLHFFKYLLTLIMKSLLLRKKLVAVIIEIQKRYRKQHFVPMPELFVKECSFLCVWRTNHIAIS